MDLLTLAVCGAWLYRHHPEARCMNLRFVWNAKRGAWAVKAPVSSAWDATVWSDATLGSAA